MKKNTQLLDNNKFQSWISLCTGSGKIFLPFQKKLMIHLIYLLFIVRVSLIDITNYFDIYRVFCLLTDVCSNFYSII